MPLGRKLLAALVIILAMVGLTILPELGISGIWLGLIFGAIMVVYMVCLGIIKRRKRSMAKALGLGSITGAVAGEATEEGVEGVIDSLLD